MLGFSIGNVDGNNVRIMYMNWERLSNKHKVLDFDGEEYFK